MWNFFKHGGDTRATAQNEPPTQLKKIFEGVLADTQKHREIRDRKDDKEMMQEIAFGKNSLYSSIEMFMDEFKKQASVPSPSSWYMEAILEAIPRSQTTDQYKYKKITELEGAVGRMEDEPAKQMLRSKIAFMKQNHVCLLHGKVEMEEKPAEK